MFVLKKASSVPLDAIPNEKLNELLDFWRRKCGRDPFPRLGAINPAEVQKHLPRMHLLVVEGPDVFRYSIYGSGVTNPDMLDMTGRTTLDYVDKEFGRLVTAHIGEAVRLAAPSCYHIEAETDGKPYKYIRLSLPIGQAGKVSHVLVGTQRIEVDPSVDRTVSGTRPA